MNAMIVLLGGLAILVIGYVLYGGWLAKQWGVDWRHLLRRCA